MHFHDLDEDVLAQILVSCDIYAVLSFLRVNKSLRRVALAKQLWISLVLDLSLRYFIPDLHPIHGHTTAQLIAKVKSVKCGPATWSEESSVPPTVCFSRTFLGGSAKFGEVMLPPGGRYFAVWRGSNLHCYDVLTGRCAWTRSESETLSYSRWTMEVLEDGHTANFLFNRPGRLSVVQVNLITGHAEEVFDLDLNTQTACYYSPAVLFENFLAVRVVRYSPHERFGILVIDWREATYVIFETPAIPDHEVAFVPGHIILTPPTLEPSHDRLIFVYALRSIASRWRPTTELVLHNADVLFAQHICLPEDISPIIVERLEHNNRVFRSFPSRALCSEPSLDVRMTVHSNPIRDNVYKLVVYASDTEPTRPSLTETFRQKFQVGGAPGRAMGTMFFTYELVLGGPGLSWTKTSVISKLPKDIEPGWSQTYAGYAVVFPLIRTDCTRIVDPRSTRGSVRKFTGRAVREVLPVCKKYTRLTSTGVVFAQVDNRIEISCYL
ncbi:hypothetical protein B0H12DRAFT_1240834 [Mycena haematopus]|nr:hypothetical protein B0H12DRAFT_1240834 [Mycena haematopus]